MKLRLLLCLWMVGGWAGTAMAQGVLEDGEVLLNGFTQELGGIVYAGPSEFSLPELDLHPNVQGLYWRDRNGMVTRVTAGIIIAVGSALAQSGPKSVESNSYQSGNYIITETRTTYYSEAEKAEMRAATASTIDGLFSTRNAEAELQVFARDRFGRGDASGFKLNMVLGGGGRYWAFETGMGFGIVDSLMTVGTAKHSLRYEYLGMPFRLGIGFSKFRALLQVDWNWLAYGDDPLEKTLPDGTIEHRIVRHPLTAAIQAAIFGRVGLSGGVTMPSASKASAPGYFLSAGLRF